MTVGFFSPLPPAPTGVADYSAALLAALSKLADVRVGDTAADVCLYHLGNNPLHSEIYRQALARPGVVVLHDAVLHHLLLGSLDRQSYFEEFVYNYGESERGRAARLWDARSRSAQDASYFDRALVRRIGEVSRAVVVHNPAAARIVRDHAPGARVAEIPHLFAPGWGGADPPVRAGPPGPAQADEGVGRGPGGPPHPRDAFLFGVFGHLRESKRLPGILRAFDRVRSRCARVRLLVAGDFVSQDLESALAPMLSAPGVLRAPYVPEPEFQALAASVDACISLRHPSARETSGIAIRLMGMGKPVLVSAGEEVVRFPDDAVIRIDRGLAEEPLLVDYMMWLVEHPEQARQIGARAAAHIAAHHSPDLVARRYFELLSSCCR
ncbi:MAG TPA: glycosyltransferase [Bryobacteraceae bacterium]